MKKKTRRALEGAIDKWEDIVAGKEIDEGTHNCPLCKLFLKNDDCTKCPVVLATGKENCIGTPYVRFNDYILPVIHNQDSSHRIVSSGYDFSGRIGKRQLKVAKDMLQFLKSLRPKRKNKKPAEAKT